MTEQEIQQEIDKVFEELERERSRKRMLREDQWIEDQIFNR